MSLRLHIRNLGILAFGELLTRALTIVAFVHLARALQPETYGQVELTLAIMMFATLIVDQGFAVLGARDVAREPACEAVLAGRIVSIQLVMALLGVALLAGMSALLPIARSLRILLMGYAVSLLAYPFLLGWLFQGRREMGWYALGQVARQAVFAGLAITLVRAPQDIARLPPAEIAAVSVSAALLTGAYFARGGRLAIRPLARENWKILRHNLPIAGSNLIWVARMFGPIVLVSALLGSAATGYFGAAHRIMMLLQTLMAVYFINLLPTLSRAAVSTERLAGVLESSLPFLAWTCVLGAIFAAVASNRAIGLLYGRAFVDGGAAITFATLVWIVPILAVRRHLVSSLVALHRQVDEFRCSISGLVSLAALLIVLTPVWGALGAAAAMVLSELLATALTWRALRQSVPQLSLLSIALPPRARILGAAAAKSP
ncbi:MAG: oligosaccharide flippase family protein [Phycisphaerae bacterium]